MDGSNQEVLHDTDLLFPNDLTIDYDLQRLYWVDLRAIEYSDLNGHGRTILLSFSGVLDLPFFIAISGDFVYWNKYFGGTVYKIHKELPNSFALSVYENETLPLLGDFKVVDALQQQANSKCQHYDNSVRTL